MDYTTQPFLFKVKKILRYVNMYGVSRTYIKITSQLHMKSSEEFDSSTWVNQKARCDGNVAVVGCGNFSYSTIAHYVEGFSGGKIKYALDVDKAKARSLVEKYKIYAATTDFEIVLKDDAVKIVYIASNHASHAEYAISAIEAGKAVHIEKPHAVNEEQLRRLVRAMKENPESKVFLGFNRPKSSLFKTLLDSMDKQPGSSMLNWFVAGHAIEDGHWYFSEQEGGRILGNLCHWSDLCVHLVGEDQSFPCTVSPAQTIGNDKSNFAVNITFNDGSQAGITFSAKGHTFEGVREYLNVHKGDLLASLQDFQKLTIDVVDKKKVYRRTHRDHGHKANIVNSYIKAISPEAKGESVGYVLGTGLLVIKIKEAIDTGKTVSCQLEY